MILTAEQIALLKDEGLQRYEISHFKHGRDNKISSCKLKLMKRLVTPRKKKNDKPFVITTEGIFIARSRNIIILRSKK